MSEELEALSRLVKAINESMVSSIAYLWIVDGNLQDLNEIKELKLAIAKAKNVLEVNNVSR